MEAEKAKQVVSLFGIIGLFELAQKLIATATPWPRLGLLIMLAAFAYFKSGFDRQVTALLQSVFIQRLVVILFCVVAIVRLGVFIRKVYQPVHHQEDIARVYLKSIEVLFQQQKNPYLQNLDPYPIKVNGQSVLFSGPKYPPLQILTYAPFVLLAKEHGIYWGNLVAYLLMLAFIMATLYPSFPYRAFLAGILYLATDYFFTKAFMKGINDFLPTALVLFSFYFFQHKAGQKAGILLGLSAAAKQLPAGVLLLLFLCYRQWQIVLSSGVVFLLVVFPWLGGGALIPFIQNVLLFNLWRPARQSALQFYLSASMGQLLFSFTIIVIGASALYFSRRPNSRWHLRRGYGYISIVLTLFLIAAKMSPAHYFVWVFPFYILWYLLPEGERE